MATEAQILDALKAIIDPDLGRDIVSLGFVKNIKIDGGSVGFDIELTTPACPVKESFRSEAERLVMALEGVESVDVNMTAMTPKAKQGPEIDTLKGVGAVIAVSSCKGGVGKSTVSAHLARAIQRQGHKVGLLDIDLYGPSLPTLFQVQNPDVYMRQNLIQPLEIDGLKTVSLGYMMGDKPAVMRGPMVSNYTMQLLRQTEWGELDYLIIDMPPGTGDIQLTLVQQAMLDGAIIVTTPQALSLVDVARGILMFESTNVPVLGVVENMAWFECDQCSAKHHIFGSGSDMLKSRFGVDTLAQLPMLPGVSDTSKLSSGADIEAFTTLAENLHREIGKRRIEGDDKPVVTGVDGHIQVAWPDGTTTKVANKALRVSCQCALCINEYTNEPILDPDTVPEAIEVEEIQPLGNYAVAISWSDGHSSGIFSWDHLRNITA